MIKVFIGWDPRESDAWQVAANSILKHSNDVTVHKLVRSEIKEYKRTDPLATSEFTLTRFLVPYLSDYRGYSIFVDCDVLCTTDISKIMDEVNPKKMVSCVQHEEYEPLTKIKMDGVEQHKYPRKNWSSVMVFNNQACKILTPGMVNICSPGYLHRMQWAPTALIGELSHTWNYLVGYYHDIDKPNLIHYTDGGPWFNNYKDCEFAEEWFKEWKNI